jgi:hypothetical protein
MIYRVTRCYIPKESRPTLQKLFFQELYVYISVYLIINTNISVWTFQTVPFLYNDWLILPA